MPAFTIYIVISDDAKGLRSNVFAFPLDCYRFLAEAAHGLRENERAELTQFIESGEPAAFWELFNVARDSSRYLQVRNSPNRPATQPFLNMNKFEIQRSQKVERFLELAEKYENIATGRHMVARQTLEMIPMGQPILVGHHSEKRHRRNLARVD
jgi:hypothetical protein